MGIGHPFVDALFEYYKSDAISGDVLNVKNGNVPGKLSARHLFKIDFEDNTHKEFYKEFILAGEDTGINDINLLHKNNWEVESNIQGIEDLGRQLEILVRNYEAELRSQYDGILNIRASCVGLIYIQ